MKRIITFILSLILIFTLTACSLATVPPTISSDEGIVATGVFSGTDETTTNTTVPAITDPTSDNTEINEDEEDYSWDNSTEIPIGLNGGSIAAEGSGITVDGSTVTITAAGAYNLSGSLTDGQVIIDTDDEGVVHLILNDVDLHSSTSAPIFIRKADKVVIVLADGSVNSITDGDAYILEDPTSDEPNAAIFSRADLTIYGSGSLTVNANYNDGIASKDGLIIASGTIVVNAVDDGIRGKDYVVVEGGNITITAQGDGLKADIEDDASKGFILINSGMLNITSGGDAIASQTDVTISDGNFTLSTTGSGNDQSDGIISATAIKGVVSVLIGGGTFSIDSDDDAIHSNGSVTINGGTFEIYSGNDGIHADSTLTINDGQIQITDSYEGLESAVITINAGDIKVTSSDDAINVAGGGDSSGIGGKPGRGNDTFTYSGDYYLYINGGTVTVNADGDGLDINGAIEMTGGLVIVNGPTMQNNGPLDYDGGFKMTGGTLVAAGSAGMAQAPDNGSSQYSALIFFSSTLPAGSLVHIQDSTGNEVLTFTTAKETQSIAFSSPELAEGMTYDIYLDGGTTGTAIDGLYQDGTYTPGSLYTSFTVSSITTQVGSGGGGRFRP